MPSNEFLKPYEYLDEEGKVSGLLLTFAIMLIFCDMFFAVSAFTQVLGILRNNSVATMIYQWSGWIFMALIVFTCAAIFMLRKYSALVAKTYLLIRLIFFFYSNLFIFNFRFHDPHSIGIHISQFLSMQDLIWKCLIIPMIYVILFSVGWYLYFNRSKRTNKYAQL